MKKERKHQLDELWMYTEVGEWAVAKAENRTEDAKRIIEKVFDCMMTADRELFLWNKEDSWWDYDSEGNVVLTADAPKEAVESFEKYKKKVKYAKFK